MNDELKIIKKKYGEKMMHLCRELFATILDNSPGVLVKILFDTFEPSHFLYDDLKKSYYIPVFKDYIYSIYDNLRITSGESKIIRMVPDPVTLMRQAGYTLYKCTTEEDIQTFKKYYSKGEELCTFNGGRLNRNYVYFAVKDNALELKRHNFHKPSRQDEYGTSVISIQFTRDDSHTLSIKNRYNHTVSNPDATYSNDLDNIIPGLTQSFAGYYGMIQSHYQNKIYDFPGYVRANDGKFYKYNYEINNVYYCPNNIVIDNFQVTKYDKEKYLVIDYFIIDLVHKTITSLVQDSFCQMLNNAKSITIVKDGHDKVITVVNETGETIFIKIDKYCQIIGLKNNNVTEIGHDFLCHNRTLKELTLDNVQEIGHLFLYNNESLTTLCLPKVLKIDSFFMSRSIITNLSLPQVTHIGDYFMSSNHFLSKLSLPEIKVIGSCFLHYNQILEAISLPKAEIIGSSFLEHNIYLETISFPNAIKIGNDFCYYNENITQVNLPNVQDIGNRFLHNNKELTKIEIPKVLLIGHAFLSSNSKIETIVLPQVISVGVGLLSCNNNIKEFYVPLLETSLDNRKLRHLQRKSKRKYLKQNKGN